MTWSYSGDPASSTLNKVRFIIVDTDTTNQQITNEEITFLLTEWNDDAYLSGAHACDSLASKYATKSDNSKSVGDLSLSTSFGDQSSRFAEQSARLRAQAMAAAPPSPTFYVTDTDDVFGAMIFGIGMDDNRS